MYWFDSDMVLVPIQEHISVGHWILQDIPLTNACAKIYYKKLCPAYASGMVEYVHTDFIRNLAVG